MTYNSLRQGSAGGPCTWLIVHWNVRIDVEAVTRIEELPHFGSVSRSRRAEELAVAFGCLRLDLFSRFSSCCS
jgi:hypothetical protein